MSRRARRFLLLVPYFWVPRRGLWIPSDRELRRLMAAIAHEQTSSVNSTASSTTHDLTHTTQGSDRCTVVIVAQDAGAVDVTGVVWDPAGDNITLDALGTAGTTTCRCEMFGKAGLAAGTKTVRATLASANAVQMGAQTYSGVDQGSPFGSFAGILDTSGAAVSLDVSSAANDMVVGGLAEETAGTIGVNGGETLRWNLSFGGGCEELAVGATTNLSWTSTASDDGAAGGVALKPAAGGGPGFDSDRGFLRHPKPPIRELVAREIAAGVRA